VDCQKKFQEKLGSREWRSWGKKTKKEKHGEIPLCLASKILLVTVRGGARTSFSGGFTTKNLMWPTKTNSKRPKRKLEELPRADLWWGAGMLEDIKILKRRKMQGACN